ncbi:MAG: serine/threonine protein kinase [Proteobacteria bacterium]|nr:serine/threonine protein kinase [Pseudomonadota bacterium]
MTDLSGTILDGKYELSRLLGEGGMGTVYEATHKLIGRRLAVKFLHPQYVTSEEVVTRFQREAQAAAAIGHENIIEVTDMGKMEDDSPYIVMEFLDGKDVKAAITEDKVLSTSRAARIMVQALSALHAAHEVGIIHRDLKPENIYLIEKSDRPDYVKILDFGISKFRSLESEGSKGLTQTGTVLGTPYYMSPEQARGDQNLSSRSDIYAMGVMLYQMLTGSLPFDAPNYNALLIKILTEDHVSPDELNPSLPPELVETINIAMDRDPERRFPTCLDFRQRLLPFLPDSSNIRLETGLSPASRTAVQAALSTDTETPLEMTQSTFIKPASKLPFIIGGALLAIAAVVGVIFFGFSGEKKAPANAVVAGPATQSKEEKDSTKDESAKKVENINLEISATPQKARIKIDGTEMKGNPYVGSFPKDSNMHQVEIVADGFIAETAQIQLDRDQKLSYKLAKAEKEKSRSRSRDKRRGSSSRSSRDSKRKAGKARAAEPVTDKPKVEKPKKDRKKPRRKIDDEDPWG